MLNQWERGNIKQIDKINRHLEVLGGYVFKDFTDVDLWDFKTYMHAYTYHCENNKWETILGFRFVLFWFDGEKELLFLWKCDVFLFIHLIWNEYMKFHFNSESKIDQNINKKLYNYYWIVSLKVIKRRVIHNLQMLGWINCKVHFFILFFEFVWVLYFVKMEVVIVIFWECLVKKKIEFTYKIIFLAIF